MNRMYFKHDENGVVIEVKNDPGLKADGSTLNISDKLLEDALKTGLFDKKAYARGYDNTYYRCGNITFLRISDNQVIVIDSYLENPEEDEWGLVESNSELQGVWLAEIFKQKSVSIKRSNGNRIDRGIPRISITKVQHNTYVKLTDGRIVKRDKVDKNHPVELARVIHELNRGGLEKATSTNMFRLGGLELHHDGYDFDNRMCKTIVMNQKEHDEFHVLNGGNYSHQCYIKVNDLDELKALIEMMNTNYMVVSNLKQRSRAAR